MEGLSEPKVQFLYFHGVSEYTILAVTKKKYRTFYAKITILTQIFFSENTLQINTEGFSEPQVQFLSFGVKCLRRSS